MHDIRTGTCPLCEGEEIIKAFPAGTALASRSTGSTRNDPSQHVGPIANYMCRECGFVQGFVEYPEEVPVDEQYATSLVEREASKKPPCR